MDDQIKVRIEKALNEQDSPKFTSSSGPTLTLMTELLNEDNLQAFMSLYTAFSRRYPSKVHYVNNRIPAKIRNFLINHRTIDSTSLAEWTKDNPGWEKGLKDALRNSRRFETRVEGIARAITDSHK